MKKDFDVERAERHAAREEELGDRTFQLGGETFTFLANPSYTVLGEVTSIGELDGAPLIRQLEKAAAELIEPEDRERFVARIRNPETPITLFDLSEIVNWVTSEQTGRPTQASSLSTPGGETTSTSSKEGSSSKPAVVSVA